MTFARKLIQFPNFTWFLPEENARILHNNCPKIFFRNLGGGGTCPLPPASTLMVFGMDECSVGSKSGTADYHRHQLVGGRASNPHQSEAGRRISSQILKWEKSLAGRGKSFGIKCPESWQQCPNALRRRWQTTVVMRVRPQALRTDVSVVYEAGPCNVQNAFNCWQGTWNDAILLMY